MKRKILIFSLTALMLFGVFSVSAFADNSMYETDTFVFDDSVRFADFSSSVKFTSDDLNFTSITFDQIYSGGSYSYYIYYHNNSDKIKVYDNYTGWVTEGYKTIKLSNTTFGRWFDVSTCEKYGQMGTFIESHVHTYTESVISPTHTEKGYTLYLCECGVSYIDNYVNALGHNYTTTTVESTCTNKGYITYTCSCGHTYTEENAVLGHKYTSTTVESTCSKKGSKTYICSLCNHTYSESLPTTQHTFVEKNCSACGALNPDFLVKSKDFSTVITSMGKQFSVKTVVGVLGVIAIAVVGLVFMWSAIRKVISIFMKAFRKGKISI